MDRGSSKHGARLDDKMADEAQHIRRSESGGGRAEQWRELEPDAGRGRAPAGGAPGGMTAAEREERSRLGQYLRRSTFPADRSGLMDEVTAMAAPVDIVAAVTSLPHGETFRNVADVWTALAGASEEELEPRF